MAEPERLVVVTGTGTEVGKTWVAARVLEELSGAGVICAARKPAQSFDLGDTSPTDAQVLAMATGEDPDVVCPSHRNYPVAMAPPMAADALGRDAITASALRSELHDSWPDPVAQLGLVELAGGIRSPMAHDADCGGFAAMLEPDHLVLVADAGLGTINAVMSALDALSAIGLGDGSGSADRSCRVVVHLNRYDDSDDLHRRNRLWLADAGCEPITGTPSELAEHLGAGT